MAKLNHKNILTHFSIIALILNNNHSKIKKHTFYPIYKFSRVILIKK